MKRNILILLVLFLNISLLAANEIDSLLRVLDTTIEHRPFYEQKREHRIDSLKIELGKIADLDQRYSSYYKFLRE